MATRKLRKSPKVPTRLLHAFAKPGVLWDIRQHWDSLGSSSVSFFLAERSKERGDGRDERARHGKEEESEKERAREREREREREAKDRQREREGRGKHVERN